MTVQHLLDEARAAERRMHLFGTECEYTIGFTFMRDRYEHALCEVRSSMYDMEDALYQAYLLSR